MALLTIINNSIHRDRAKRVFATKFSHQKARKAQNILKTNKNRFSREFIQGSANTSRNGNAITHNFLHNDQQQEHQ